MNFVNVGDRRPVLSPDNYVLVLVTERVITSTSFVVRACVRDILGAHYRAIVIHWEWVKGDIDETLTLVSTALNQARR